MSRVEYSNSNEEQNAEDNTSVFDDSNNDNGQRHKKRGRGYDKPKWGKSGKESIAFTEDGLCVDPKDAQLSRYLGSLVKNSRFLPLTPVDWRLHEDSTMDHVWKTIYDTINWRPEDVPNIPKIRLVLLQRLSDRCRNYKASLKEKYYTPYIGLPERFLCGDERLDRDQWRAMVNYWDTDPKNKARCEKNIENRKRLKTSHTGGTKSFVRHMADHEKKHGDKPDCVKMFYMMHTRNDENNSWIDNASEELAAKISQKLAELVEIHGEETPELRQQAYVAVRGFETRGRVRGYGSGVTPEMVPWVAQTQPTSSSLRSRTGRAYANLQSQYSELEAKYERQQKELDELKQMMTSGNVHLHQQSPSQYQSSSQQRSPSQQQSTSQQTPTSFQYPPYQYRPRSPSQQHSPSRHTSTLHPYHPYQRRPPYPYAPSSQFYYQPYQPPLYHPVPHPPGEFTAMLNDSDFMQQMIPPDDRNCREQS